MLCVGFDDVSSDDFDPLELSCMASLYPISVGTLSEVMPDVYKHEEACCYAIRGVHTIASRPCLDDVYVVGSSRVYSSHAYSPSASVLSDLAGIPITHRYMSFQSQLRQSTYLAPRLKKIHLRRSQYWHW
jgi:hypothetical protein